MSETSRPRSLTLSALAERMDAEFAAIRAELDTIKAQEQTHQTRRTEDMRQMVREEISEQTKALADELVQFRSDMTAFRLDVSGRLEKSDAFDKKVQLLIDDYDERLTREAERDRRGRRMESALSELKPWVMAGVTFILTGKAQQLGAIPPWAFWAIASVVVLVVVGWPVYRTLTGKDDDRPAGSGGGGT